MKRRGAGPSKGCPVEATLAVIGGKWKGVILYYILESTKRFSELRRLLPDVSQRMLTLQLREMERDKLITRTIYPEIPPRVEYTITELGQSLNPIIQQMRVWGLNYLKD